MLVDDFIFTPDDFAVKEKKKAERKKMGHSSTNDIF